MFERSIKPILINIINSVKEKWDEIHIDYGILGLIASVAVPLKIFFFYHLIGVTSNFFFVWFITCLLTYLLFSSIQNKWIPTVIYALLTILMFCDVTYSSFFNRYLSVAMLGAAGVLGDITESIKEVLKPWFILVMADAILITSSLTVRKIKRKTDKTEGERAEIEAVAEIPAENLLTENLSEDNTSIENITIDTLLTEYIAVPIDASSEVIEISLGIETLDEIDKSDEIDASGEIGTSDQIDTSGEVITNDSSSSDTIENAINRSGRRARKEKKKKNQFKFKNWLMDHKKPVAALMIIFLLVFNFSGSFFITSLSNQEIYSYHIKDIVGKLTGNSADHGGEDFTKLIADTYQTEKNGPIFGVAKGKNLIIIQMESMQNIVINKTYNGQEITPNLNQIIKGNTIYFDHYYQQIGSGNTSDAEFATNNSIYGTLASYTYKLFDNNYFRGLPVLLKEQGYETAVYHAHEDRNFWNREDAYQSLGFDTYYGGIGGTDIGQYNMTEWMGWGLTDSEFFQQTMGYLKEMTQPFYSFIITLSNHHPYKMLDKYQFIDLLPEDEDTIFGNYLNSAAYTDYAIGQLMQQLKDEGIYDNSIIALYGDHMGLPKSDEEIFESVSKFLGKDYDYDTMMNIPLIITVPGTEQDINQTVSISGGQIDFLPTIAYLMGFESLDTIYLGHNLLTIDSGFVAEQTYMTKGSFFQDDIVYVMSRDGVFENGRAWNQTTGKPVPVKDCYDGYLRSMGIINASDYILENDVLRKIYLEEQDTVSAFSNSAVMEYPNEIAVAGVPDSNLIGTNSLEALDHTYNAGYRNIKIQVCWTEDKEAVLLSEWQALSKYFNTDKNHEVSLEAFQNLEMKNNLTSMDYLDLIAWVKEHPDVNIVAQAERSSDYFMKCMNSYAGSIMDQFISEVPGMMEYSGLYHTILNIDMGKNTAEQLIEFIKLNQVPAVVMSKNNAEGIYKSVLDAGCISYIKNDSTGLITKN